MSDYNSIVENKDSDKKEVSKIPVPEKRPKGVEISMQTDESQVMNEDSFIKVDLPDVKKQETFGTSKDLASNVKSTTNQQAHDGSNEEG